MKVLRTRAELREAIARFRAGVPDGVVGLVPTMGALHAGHLALADHARAEADVVVLSVYVNPLQFGAGEDFSRYPRGLERDAELAAARGVDIVFAPDDREMYPAGEALVRVAPGPMGEGLCGAFRPGHFEGVLTVVAKLFNLATPDVAVFGQKDFQQAALIRRMALDLDFPVRVDVVPIVREPDGLALSSRNVYLGEDERRRAASLSRGLAKAEAAFRAGERDADALRSRVRAELDGIEPQYVEVVDPETLAPVERAEPGSVVALAAFVGSTRLIDNTILR